MATPTPIGGHWKDVWDPVWLEVWDQTGELPTPVGTVADERNTGSFVRRLKKRRRS